MSFFKKLFGRDLQGFINKGQTFLTNGEWGQARGAFLEAARQIDGQTDVSLKEAAEAGLRKANAQLLAIHLADAQTFATSGSSARALERLEAALEFAADDAERDDIVHRIKAIDAAQGAEAMIEALDAAPPVEDDPMEEDDETFLALLSTLSDEQADVYESLGAGFRGAYLAMNSGRYDEAEALLLPVYEQSPDNVYLQYELGRLRLGQGRYEEAEALLREAGPKAPDMVALRHARVEALWGLKDWEQAERVVEEAFEIDDELLENYLIAGRTCLLSGELDNGVELMEAGLSVHAQSIALHRLLGQLQMARDNAPGAILAFESALSLRWQYNYETGQLLFDRESAFMAANLYLSTRTNLARAEELFRALLSTGEEGGRLAFLVGLAQTFQQQGELGKAREFLVEAARLAPDGSQELAKIESMLADTVES